MFSISSLIASFLLATFPLSIAKDIACEVPSSFTVNLSYDVKTTISDAELILQTEKNVLYLDTTPGLDSVRFLTDKVFVIFRGKAQIYDRSNQTVKGPTEISELSHESLIGEADRSILTPEGAATASCRIALLPAESRRPRTHPWIAKEIYALAEACAQRKICSKIRSKYLGVEKRLSTVKSPSEFELTNRNSTEDKCASTKLQTTLNLLADMGIAKGIEMLKNGDGLLEGVKLPEVSIDFDVGSGFFKTTGSIRLWDGTVSGLETLRRRSDASISHNGLKLTAACEIGLDRADINFKNYELQYGIRASGKLTAFVDGVALAMQISVDYDKNPCVMTLDHLKITDFGGLLIDMTGLGRPLEWIISTITEWITTKFHGSIASALEDKIRKAIEPKLMSFDCETFRAWN